MTPFGSFGLGMGLGGAAGGGNILRFGFITDVHNADIPPENDRYFQDAPEKLDAAVAVLNQHRLDFIYVNGDVVNGSGGLEPSTVDLNVVMERLDAARAPKHYAAGNHDYQVFTLEQFSGITGMDPQGYYSFDVKGVRFISLDANYFADDDDSHYAPGNFTYQDTYIPPTQRAWLADTLAAAPGKVIVFCHQRLEQQTGANYVKNADAVRALLEAADNVIGVFMGHAHLNARTFINGIPYVECEALVEFAYPTNAFSIITVENDLASIEGFGEQSDWGLLDPFPDARPLIDRFEVPPTQARADLINATVAALQDAGIWSKLDYLHVMAAADEQGACLNWISEVVPYLVPVGGMTFTSDKGFTGDGATGYLNIGVAVNALTKYQQNDASMGAWALTAGSAGLGLMGVQPSGTNNNISNNNGATERRVRMNTPTTLQTNDDVTTGLVVGVRRDASNQYSYRNGTGEQTGAAASAALSTQAMCYGRSGAAFGNQQICFGFAGSQLSAGEVSALYDVIMAYLVAVGAVVDPP